MMSLKDLDKLIEPHIEGNKVVETQISSLVKPGENNGGELFKIDIHLQDPNKKNAEVLHLVGKVIPNDEKTQEIFNIQNTFKAEIAFYNKIVPALKSFHEEYNIQDLIDVFPTYYGSRCNLNGSDIVDRDGIILLENLKVKGYNNVDRYVGYNLEDAKNLLKDLAIFQSTVVALKIQQPDIFNSQVKPYCNNSLGNIENDPFEHFTLVIEDILREADISSSIIAQVKEAFAKSNIKRDVREPFATICHRDLWVNNTMIKQESDTPSKNKFVDFQFYDYGSPALDVLNFIFTSVQTEVAKENFQNLVNHYHSEFVSNLERFGCDTDEFNYVNFEKELELESEVALGWAIGFVPLVVFGKKDENMLQNIDLNFKDSAFRKKVLDTIMPEAKEKMCFMVLNSINKFGCKIK